jgi:hypothetical protein
MVIHEGTPLALHVQPVFVVMETVLATPVAGAEMLAGVTLNAQVPDWTTLNERPAMVTAPVRCVIALFAVTRMVAVPFPEPLLPEVTVIHETPLVAVHAQPLPAVTATVVVSPPVTTALLAGLME